MNEIIQAKDKAIKNAGGCNSLAKKLFRSMGTGATVEDKQRLAWAIAKWNNGVPSHWVLSVEKVTGISRHLLRPDLYPNEVV